MGVRWIQQKGHAVVGCSKMSSVSGDLAGRTTDDLLSFSCGRCGIIRPEDWHGVAPQVLGALNRRKRIRQRERGEVLFHQGDAVSCLYRLLDGIVLLRQGDSVGTSVTTHMVSAGQTMGFRAFVDGGVHGVTAYCATDVVLCGIPADIAVQAFDGSHPLERVFTRHVAAELTATEESVLSMTSRPVSERLLLVFARLCLLCGHLGENGEARLAIPLLRADLAGLAGIARETFSRAMHALEEDGLVRLDGEAAVFPDVARFRRRVDLIQPGFWCS